MQTILHSELVHSFTHIKKRKSRTNRRKSVRSKCFKGSTHELGDKQDFEVSSETPSSEIMVVDSLPNQTN